MALITSPSYECKMFLRTSDGSERRDNTPVIFMAQVVGNKEKAYRQIMGFTTPTTRLVLRTDSEDIYSFKQGQGVLAQVEFQGDIYQVQSITYDISNAFGLSAGKFTKEHNERNAIKVLVLS